MERGRGREKRRKFYETRESFKGNFTSLSCAFFSVMNYLEGAARSKKILNDSFMMRASFVAVDKEGLALVLVMISLQTTVIKAGVVSTKSAPPHATQCTSHHA
jgi:hypothetical protein